MVCCTVLLAFYELVEMRQQSLALFGDEARRVSFAIRLLLAALVLGIAFAVAAIDNVEPEETCSSGSGSGSASGKSSCSATTTASENGSDCGLYMAESTIPGAGLGIFTAAEKHPGDAVGYGDVCIPVVGAYRALLACCGCTSLFCILLSYSLSIRIHTCTFYL